MGRSKLGTWNQELGTIGLTGPEIKVLFQDGGRLQATQEFLEIKAVSIPCRRFMPGTGPARRRQQGIIPGPAG